MTTLRVQPHPASSDPCTPQTTRCLRRPSPPYSLHLGKEQALPVGCQAHTHGWVCMRAQRAPPEHVCKETDCCLEDHLGRKERVEGKKCTDCPSHPAACAPSPFLLRTSGNSVLLHRVMSPTQCLGHLSACLTGEFKCHLHVFPILRRKIENC
eukprot:1160277-Pelagomonas_calceolata.AAC.5